MISITFQPKENDIILFIGGGAVAERRLTPFIGEPCRCIVISPEVTDVILRWHEQGLVTWYNRAYEEQHDMDRLSECRMLFIATDNRTVNDELYGRAKELGVWVNRCDDASLCDFTIPSVLDVGDLHIAINANNAGPRINQLVKADMTDRYRELQTAIPHLKILREEVKLLISDGDERRDFWRHHLNTETFHAILRGEWSAIEEKLHSAISGIRSKS